MFDKFTHRAKYVMQLANQEAQRFNHDYLGVEHILLGLIKEGSGVAANVLKYKGVDLKTARIQVERFTAPTHKVDNQTEIKPTVILAYTPRAIKTIEHAQQAARDLNHTYIGTEHILIGLVRETEGPAINLLSAFGISDVDILMEIGTLLDAKHILLQHKIQNLAKEKEKAVSKQDFLMADTIKKQMNYLRELQNEATSKCELNKDGATVSAKEILHKISCTVLSHYVGDLDAESAIEKIRILL